MALYIILFIVYFVIIVFSLSVFKKCILTNKKPDSCLYCSCSKCAVDNEMEDNKIPICPVWKLAALFWPISYIVLFLFFGGRYLGKIFDSLLNKFL